MQTLKKKMENDQGVQKYLSSSNSEIEELIRLGIVNVRLTKPETPEFVFTFVLVLESFAFGLVESEEVKLLNEDLLLGEEIPLSDRLSMERERESLDNRGGKFKYSIIED